MNLTATDATKEQPGKHKIVVVGGGAGGLSLVSKLGRKYRRDKQVDVVLVDHKPTHLWKPLLHEVATGSLDSNHDEVSYVNLARRHGFQFVLGSLHSIKADQRFIEIKRKFGESDQIKNELPEVTQKIKYDQLVLAVGSVSNDFSTKGVSENAIYLDDRTQAEKFHRRLIANLHRVNNLPEKEPKQLSIVIVGGGATGVELAADLKSVASQLEDYGFKAFNPENMHITILEAGSRLLVQLPERISKSVKSELNALGVEVKTDSMVTEITETEVMTKKGEVYSADMSVWAAGIRAPEVLANSGLETDGIGRIITTQMLNTEAFPEIFVIGDSCHCPNGVGPDAETVPPRAQSAHQMSMCSYNNIVRQYKGQPLKTFLYQDFGSLVSLSKYSTVGNLMGNLMRGTLFVEGWLARIIYRMLYRRHQYAIHGMLGTGLIIVGDRIRNSTHSHLKLH